MSQVPIDKPLPPLASAPPRSSSYNEKSIIPTSPNLSPYYDAQRLAQPLQPTGSPSGIRSRKSPVLNGIQGQIQGKSPIGENKETNEFLTWMEGPLGGKLPLSWVAKRSSNLGKDHVQQVKDKLRSMGVDADNSGLVAPGQSMTIMNVNVDEAFDQWETKAAITMMNNGYGEYGTKLKSPFLQDIKKSSLVQQVPEKEISKEQAKLDKEAQKQFHTKRVIKFIANMWWFHLLFICGFSYVMTFYVPQYYVDDEIWNTSCWWKLGYLLPLPYTLICFFGLILPFRLPMKPDKEFETYKLNKGEKREIDNLYICIVTRGSNPDAVHRSFRTMEGLQQIHPCVSVHVLTDEPFHYPDISCFSCPKEFSTARSKYKARALEWYRRTLQLTERDWILHLDEESCIDSAGVEAVLDYIRYTKYEMGQGPIFYNQYRYWTNPVFTVADALRVGDDVSRFHLQYTFFKRPIFGAHGSFLLTNGVVENTVTWDLGSLTEDFEFAVQAWKAGFRIGEVPAVVREQSPQRFIDFLKQRRRWFVGIRRLPQFLPRLLALFWSLGVLALYFTIASVVLGLVVPMGTPRWFGALKDFSFVTFVYLYILGVFLQDVDAGLHPLRIIVNIPITIIFQFIAVILECLSIMYAIVSPPKGFDVIKK